MTMINRLKLFLTSNNIGSSEFADRCEISRPTVSQLLNGRNKKISNEIIDKIHIAYPTLSIMWLMFGEGVMFTHSSGENLSVHESSLFDADIDSVTENPILERVIKDVTMDFVESNNVKGSDENTTITTETESVRKIVNIMVFYSDNSFESFKP